MDKSLQDPYPEVELAPPPRAHPLAEPRLVSPIPSQEDKIDEYSRPPSFLPNPGGPSKPKSLVGSVKSVRSKHESYNLSGSNFLITGNGKTLNLPVPSNSKSDPLNWSTLKTVGAWVSVSFYSVVALTAAQAASVVLDGIAASFQSEMPPEIGCSNKVRLVIDMSDPHDGTSVNANCPDVELHYVKLEQVGSVIKRLGPGTVLFKFDVVAAFKQIRLIIDDWCLQGETFIRDGVTYAR